MLSLMIWFALFERFVFILWVCCYVIAYYLVVVVLCFLFCFDLVGFWLCLLFWFYLIVALFGLVCVSFVVLLFILIYTSCFGWVILGLTAFELRFTYFCMFRLVCFVTLFVGFYKHLLYKRVCLIVYGLTCFFNFDWLTLFVGLVLWFCVWFWFCFYFGFVGYWLC